MSLLLKRPMRGRSDHSPESATANTPRARTLLSRLWFGAALKIAWPALFVVSGVQSAIASVERSGRARSSRVRKSG
ncbi:hypothetical protein [Kribbella caucasensis]|uniref:hypothetical protein n=1 Tax=Kribbella caucasensis TaxID=2512215 RepID=UPI001060FB60|nr:hypothetical protein [Kribbella sp. VKM Ac-2527]